MIGNEILTDLSALVALLEEADPLCSCLHFSASGHHDEVVVLPLGSSPYLRKDKRGSSIRIDSNKIEYRTVNLGEEA